MKAVVIGNSIVNGFPFRRSQCFTSLLRTEYGIETVNKGINGDTTAGILRRFEEDALSKKVDAIMILTGTNDFIGGGSVSSAVDNIKTMIAMSEERRVILLTPILTNPVMAARMWMRADYDEVNKELMEFREEIMELPGIDIIDTQMAYAEFAEGRAARDVYVDGIHPTLEGHMFIAEYIKENI